MNHVEVPMAQLDARAKELYDNYQNINYGPERAKQIRTELGMIALEMTAQHLEAKGHDVAAAFAFSDFHYFGFEAPAKGLSFGPMSVSCE